MRQKCIIINCLKQFFVMRKILFFVTLFEENLLSMFAGILNSFGSMRMLVASQDLSTSKVALCRECFFGTRGRAVKGYPLGLVC